MSKFQKLSLGIAVVLALSFVASADEPVPDPELKAVEEEKARPIVEVEVNGSKFKAPLMEDIKVSDARREFDKKTINGMFGKISEMVDLVCEGKASHWTVTKKALSIVPEARSNASELKKLRKNGDPSPPLAKEYAKKMSQLIVDIAKTKTEERIKNDEAKERAHNILEAIKKMTEKSSTGLYLDWSEFTVNDQPLPVYVAPILQWFRDNGYGWELKIFDGLALVVKSFGKKD